MGVVVTDEAVVETDRVVVPLAAEGLTVLSWPQANLKNYTMKNYLRL